MKKIFYSVLGISLLASCSKWTNTQKQLNKTAIDGTWVISSYIDNGEDETADFTTFRLDFQENDILNGTDLLSSNSNPYVGSWSITDSNGNNDSLEDLNFIMNFSVGNKLDDLSDNWDIISFTDTEIKLIDVSGGGGGTDYLTLTKH